MLKSHSTLSTYVHCTVAFVWFADFVWFQTLCVCGLCVFAKDLIMPVLHITIEIAVFGDGY